MHSLKLDLNQEAKAFPHYWEKCVGSCHATTALRQDFRDQLRKTKNECGFKYLRFHGLLDDDMSVVIKDMFTGDISYSFYNIDLIFDFLLEIGMKPFVELGFMPTAIASGDKTCFHYKANVTMPREMADWEKLIKALTEHLIERYGLAEVSSWFFEVWNEPNLRFFFAGNQADYFKLYKATADTIKAIHPKLRVGGPATSANAWVGKMISFCKESETALDFISTHHYPTDDPFAVSEGTNDEEGIDFEALMANMDQEKIKDILASLQKKDFERGVLTEMASGVKDLAEGLPIYYTEWNGGLNYDEPYQASFVLKTLKDNAGLVEGYSYWTFTDIFEELGQRPAPFSNDFGMQTVQGIEKPVYHLYRELHQAGAERISVDSEHETLEVLALKSPDEYTLFIANTQVPGKDIETVEVELAVEGLFNHATIAYIDDNHSNPKKLWESWGAPTYIDDLQVAQLKAETKMTYELVDGKANNDTMTYSMKVLPHGVAIVKLYR